MISHTDTTALVTGGASGIGKALAQALVARGAFVMIADLEQAKVDAAVAEIGDRACGFVCDLAEPAAAAKLVNDAFAWRGRLELVCSNAGIGHNKKVKNEPLDESAARLFAVNYFAAVRIAQAYLKALEPNGARGRMMITGSENSLSVPAAVKGRGLGLYGATKHGVLITAEWLRDECADTLDVHVLMPGAVYTPLIARALPDPAQAPASLGLIMPERCAAIALKGMDLGLFYIPTHAHIGDDIRPRYEGVLEALKQLGLC
jgi:NAD(P)-dependent dehydrogenase (short-subunit alcohol dehydrogenase family)